MNDKTGSIVNDDGKENAAAMRNNGKINFATFWKMELQFYGKMICNFLEKCLAKNIIGSGEFVTDGKLQIHAHSFVKFFAQNAYVAANNGKGNQHQGKKQHMEKLHLEIDVLKTKTIKKEKIKSIACNHKQTDKQKTAEDQPEYAEHKDDNINKQQHRP